MKLKPFFCFYGGKWRAVPRYPSPEYSHLVEPFAGAAGYATRYFDRDVHLFDVDPVIAGLWNYLIHVPASDVRKLPLLIEHVDLLRCCQEAKWLIGFWLNKGSSTPKNVPSKWMRDGTRPNSYWGEAIRDRIALQVEHIRHWRVTNTSYADGPNQAATWFIDPPYSTPAGSHYKHVLTDYASLAQWCRTRRGQVIVCEQKGADWLPFKHLQDQRSTPGAHRTSSYSAEVIWTKAA